MQTRQRSCAPTTHSWRRAHEILQNRGQQKRCPTRRCPAAQAYFALVFPPEVLALAAERFAGVGARIGQRGSKSGGQDCRVASRFLSWSFETFERSGSRRLAAVLP